MRRQQLWGLGDYTYVLMSAGFDPGSWRRINDTFYARYMEAQGKLTNGHWRSWLQPLTATHLQSEVGYDEPNGNLFYLYACAAVGLFILTIACINYMNLATARTLRRARSVGIRKILGASRGVLALQFLGEAVFFSMIALLLGTLPAVAALRFTGLNALMAGEVSLPFTDPVLILSLVGLGLLVGLLSGAYPALYLSSWAPVSAMAGRHTVNNGRLRMRELLVLVQFTISAAVIACTLLMSAQMRYIANKSLGFEKENRIVVKLRGVSTIEKIPTIRTELTKNSNVLGVAEAEIMMGERTGLNGCQVDNNDGVLVFSQIAHMPIGEDFAKVMGLKIVKGRDFSRHLLTDIGTNFLVNEAMVRRMGWTEPLGKRIQLLGRVGKVIGVVQDFNFKSLHSLIDPFAMYPVVDDFSQVQEAFRPLQERLLVLNISGRDVGETLDHVQHVMAQIDPRHPFEFEFVDQQLDNLHKTEHRLMSLIGVFAVVCIFIACLGLFGLAAFTTEQRSREIATRKVLGASAWQIITLLSRPILVLVLIAAVLASVIAYFAIDQWLTGFAYRAAIDPFMFVIAAIIAAVVAFATVALQAYKTASGDPVGPLREQ
jgi:putative ABC transport system permease protein